MLQDSPRLLKLNSLMLVGNLLSARKWEGNSNGSEIVLRSNKATCNLRQMLKKHLVEQCLVFCLTEFYKLSTVSFHLELPKFSFWQHWSHKICNVTLLLQRKYLISHLLCLHPVTSKSNWNALDAFLNFICHVFQTARWHFLWINTSIFLLL